MDNARIEDNNVIFPASTFLVNKTESVFPVELLETISKLGANVHKLQDALMFYGITKDAPEWYWATPKTLKGKDLTGWEIHYYQSNWEDSYWDTIQLTKGVKSEDDESAYFSVDLAGEEYSWHFDAEQNLLLVKLTVEEFDRRVTREAERVRENAEYAACMDAQAQALAQARAQERKDNPTAEENFLEDWERELLKGE